MSIVGTVPLAFVVNPSVKANSLQELIALAKANPKTLAFASSGNGSPQHLATEMFKRMAGVDVLHVPYKGSGPAMTDLIGGQVQAMIETAPSAQPQLKAGKIRALATTTAQPVSTLPGVPTAAQAGLPGFEVTSMFGVAAPAGTPDAIIQRLSAELKKILAEPETRDALLAQGAVAKRYNKVTIQAGAASRRTAARRGGPGGRGCRVLGRVRRWRARRGPSRGARRVHRHLPAPRRVQRG